MAKKRKAKTKIRQKVAPDILMKPKPAPPPAAPEQQVLTRQIVQRQTERCRACNATNSFIQTEGLRVQGTMRVASARCRSCGALAQIRQG